MIKIGLIGYGAWGPNLARCLRSLDSAVLAAVCDSSPARLAIARRTYPGAHMVDDWSELVNDSRLDAIAVATPAVSHFEVGVAALRAGKHVLIEKPLACSSKEASALVEAGEQKRLIVMVDHTYLFSPPVRMLREILAHDAVGEPLWFESERFNSGSACTDVNVLWDLAVHDLSIIDYLLPHAPRGVQATEVRSGIGRVERDVLLTVLFSNNLKVNIHAAWDAAAKTRRIQINCSRGLLIYNDLDPIEKVRVLAKSADAWSPWVAAIEPLSLAVEHFAECVMTGRRPLSDGLAGLRVVRLLEAADESLRANGRLIEVSHDAMAK